MRICVGCDGQGSVVSTNILGECLAFLASGSDPTIIIVYEILAQRHLGHQLLYWVIRK